MNSTYVNLSQTRDELRNVAKSLNIVGVWKMNKAQLVHAIEEATANVITHADETVVDESGTTERMVNKLKYVEAAMPGTLIAFRLPDGRVKSAAIEKRSSKRRVFQVVTAYGHQHTVPFNDVVWVKTGTRWPRGVYNLLKGNEINGKQE